MRAGAQPEIPRRASLLDVGSALAAWQWPCTQGRRQSHKRRPGALLDSHQSGMRLQAAGWAAGGGTGGGAPLGGAGQQVPHVNAPAAGHHLSAPHRLLEALFQLRHRLLHPPHPTSDRTCVALWTDSCTCWMLAFGCRICWDQTNDRVFHSGISVDMPKFMGKVVVLRMSLKMCMYVCLSTSRSRWQLVSACSIEDNNFTVTLLQRNSTSPHNLLRG